ncbi:8650_t:CDS:2, partial [Gigaspora rosea]
PRCSARKEAPSSPIKAAFFLLKLASCRKKYNVYVLFRLIICDAAAKEWQEIKKLEDTEIDDIIKQHYTTPLKLQGYFQSAASSSRTQVSDSTYITKNRHLLHPSSRGRPKKNQPRSSESVVEFVLISNSAEIEDFGILPSEQN